MTIKQALQYFENNRNLARALGVTDGCVANWKRFNKIPMHAQYKLQVITKNQLKADKE